MVKKPRVPLHTVFWGLWHSIIREKRGHDFFLTGNIAFFQKIVYSTTSQVLKKWSYNLDSNCQTSFWTLKSRPLRFFKLANTIKSWPKIFPHKKICLFFQKIVFSATSYVQKNCPYNNHRICQKTLWTLTNCL